MYSVYYPCHSYDQTLDVLSTTKTNSSKTSSLPLADFWHPDRNKTSKKALFSKLEINQDPQLADYCFEYPTPAYNSKNGRALPYSKPSMTDLMVIFGDDTRITIEAKYTEYVKEAEYSPLLKDWYEKDYPDGAPHRKPIIQCWIDYIHGKNRYKADELLKDCPRLPYQFLHRAASACYGCKHPILVYQLFYDKDVASIDKMKEFEKLLQKCTQQLKLEPKRLPFYIIENEVISCPQDRKGDVSDIFNEMKQEAQYQFGNSMVVINGYTQEKI